MNPGCSLKNGRGWHGAGLWKDHEWVCVCMYMCLEEEQRVWWRHGPEQQQREKGLKACRFCQQSLSCWLHMLPSRSLWRSGDTLHPSIVFSLKPTWSLLQCPGLAWEFGCSLSNRSGSASSPLPGRWDADLQTVRNVGFPALSMSAFTWAVQAYLLYKKWLPHCETRLISSYVCCLPCSSFHVTALLSQCYLMVS